MEEEMAADIADANAEKAEEENAGRCKWLMRKRVVRNRRRLYGMLVSN